MTCNYKKRGSLSRSAKASIAVPIPCYVSAVPEYKQSKYKQSKLSAKTMKYQRSRKLRFHKDFS